MAKSEKKVIKRGWKSGEQLGFERREVWTLLYPSSLPRIQATSCMMSASNWFLKPKNSLPGSATKRKQHHHAVQNPYAGHYERQNILDRREMEIYTSPPPPPQIRDRKIAGFGFCAASSFVWGQGGLACCSISFCPRL